MSEELSYPNNKNVKGIFDDGETITLNCKGGSTERKITIPKDKVKVRLEGQAVMVYDLSNSTSASSNKQKEKNAYEVVAANIVDVDAGILDGVTTPSAMDIYEKLVESINRSKKQNDLLSALDAVKDAMVDVEEAVNTAKVDIVAALA